MKNNFIFLEELRIKYDYKKEFNPFMLKPWNIDRLTVEIINPQKSVLEIGCATGYISEYLIKKKECYVVGVEINPTQAERAREKSIKVICGNIEDDEILEKIKKESEIIGGFDYILLQAVLEHLIYPDKVLHNIRDFLKNDGFLIVTLPNIAHWSIRWKLLLGKWEYEDYGLLDRTHLRFFNFNTAKKLLSVCNYKIIKWDIDFSNEIPIFKNFLRLLLIHKIIYKLFPNFFGYQFLFVCKKD